MTLPLRTNKKNAEKRRNKSDYAPTTFLFVLFFCAIGASNKLITLKQLHTFSLLGCLNRQLLTHSYHLSYRPTRLQNAMRLTACPSQCGPRMSAVVICPGFIQGRDRAIKVGVLDPKRICGSCGLCASNSFNTEADALLERDMKAQSAPFLSQTLQ